MRKKMWMNLALVMLAAVVLLSVSCAKKTVTAQKGSISTAKEEGYGTPQEEKSNDMSSTLQESDTEKTAVVVLNENVYFEFDKATLTPASRELLTDNGKWLRINSDVAITIEGHCDERGTNEYNLALGDRRAESVKMFLLDLGIDDSRLTTISYGEERPADPGHSETAWAKNRRAYFQIQY